MPSLINEQQQWFDQDTGELIVNGTVYIGEQNLDPVLNPKGIYSDRALTVSLTNPQTTGADGRTGNKIWLSGNYSIKVDDSDGVQRYIELDNGGVGGELVNTVADVIAGDYAAGNRVETNGYYSADDGGAAEYYIKTAAQAAIDGDVIDGYGNHTLANGNVAILQHANGVVLVKPYGTVGDGAADDTLNYAAALAASSGGVLRGHPSDVNRITSSLTLPVGGCHIDLNGSTLQDEVSTGSLIGSPTVVTVDYPVTTQTKGSNIVTTTAPPTGLVAGDYIGFKTDALGGWFPHTFTRVKSVVSSTVTLEHATPFAYPGNVTLMKITFTNESMKISNGFVDASGDTATDSEGIILISGYEESEVVNVNIKNADMGTTGLGSGIKIEYSLRGLIEHCNSKDCRFPSTSLQIAQSGKATIQHNNIENDSFGINTTRNDHPLVFNNTLRGQIDTGGTESIRGIKSLGNQNYQILCNTVSGYDTNIRSAESAGGQIISNIVSLSGSNGIEVNDDLPDPDWRSFHVISDNRVSDSGVDGIVTYTSNDDITAADNIVSNSQANGLNFLGDGLNISNNRIKEWDLLSGNYAAININAAQTLPSSLTDNRAWTATPANRCYKITAGTSTLIQHNNASNTNILFSTTLEAPTYANDASALRDNGCIQHSSMLTLVYTGGVVKHAFRNAQDYNDFASTYYARGVDSVSWTFQTTPTGTDGSTAMAYGGKISSASTSIFILDTADQIVTSYGYNAMSVTVAMNNTGVVLAVRPYATSRDVNGVTITRIELEFTNAATGALFDLTALTGQFMLLLNMTLKL
ncbi:MAG: right-handed parallel beta-helix repeat-containing protein [Planctomycetes bacterium]|nr:right-handed parallel beta-helix repeat-containing protein [Planctomycetota bacterium]